MIAKLTVCLCICFVVLLGSIVGFIKGLDFAGSNKPNADFIGTVISAASVILLFVSLVGVIVFVINLFIFYLYGIA